MKYQINKDGSFDVFENRIGIFGAYPAVDGKEIRPLSVETKTDKIVYHLAEGTITLDFSQDGDETVLSAKAEGLGKAFAISPVAAAEPNGCDKVFYQGLGMCGPSGFAAIRDANVSSNTLIAVGSGSSGGAMAVYARDHAVYHNVYFFKEQKLTASFETECLGKDSISLPCLYFVGGENFSDILRGCAKKIAGTMNARKIEKQSFHWCSWYYLYHNLDQPTLEDWVKEFAKYRGIAPFTHIQIDAGYFHACGDWLEPNARFADGLKKAADTIKEAGFEPGIWIGPFMVGDNSHLVKEHPDWLLKDQNGEYVRDWRIYNEPKIWGFRDCDYYTLDTSHPDAMAYLRNVFTTLHEWGYTLFKTDFLFWGLFSSNKVRRYTPGKTSVEYFRDVMQMIRESIGEDARWLGCIAPFAPAIGYVDMMRIAGDVGSTWEDSGFGPTNMIREITADQYFNNIYWQNDPDAIMLRDFHIFIEEEQIQALALLEAMSGGAMYTSDPVHLISQSRRDLLNFIRSDSIHNPEYPFWGDDSPETVIIQDLGTRRLIYFMNATKDRIVKKYDWEKLSGGKPYIRQWKGESAETKEMSYIEIPKKSGLLFFATDKPLTEDPVNMWTE